ncbi:CHC2 zinc finger domain-containing protein [Helicobacter mehlei]|uniref:CHC2 zinc finger domain-containing protein n=1 Tax=Helicobacter mehlei TaxID=2316080 RepID=UPI000EB569A6|nr:CHC2 zinc finger domain-containing protein [Helicobacter mehlei]
MIKAESLAALKEKADIIEFFCKLGHTPKRAGNVFLMHCPVHSERTPSFAINPRKNTWRCYGCGEGGNIIDFIVATQGLSFYNAAFEAARIAGIELEITHHKQEKPMPGYAILDHAHRLFQKALLEDMIVLDYLAQRGINQESARYFELGLCTPATTTQLKKAYSLEDLQECGLFNGRGHFCAFENRLIFAYKDARKRVVGFSGRTLSSDEARTAKYFNSRESAYFKKSETLWNIDRALNAIIQKKQVIITEGFFDAMLFGVHGYPHAVCISGTGFNQGHLDYFSKMGVEIALCLDNDGPGHKATMRALKMCFTPNEPYSLVCVIRLKNSSTKDVGSCPKKKPEMYKINGFKYFANARLSPEYPPQERDKNYKELMGLVGGWSPFLKHACLEILGAHAPKQVRQEISEAKSKLEANSPHLQKGYTANRLWPEGCIFATMLKDLAFRFTAQRYLSAQDFQYPKVFEALINNKVAGLNR